MLGYGELGGPPLSVAEEYSLHSRYLAKANSLNLSEIAEMKIVYRGGVDSEGRSVMVVVRAHFLLRCLDLERFILYVIKEFEPLIQKPYTVVYLHSAASLQTQPDLGWMRRLQQILGQKHQHNLHAIYVLHPTFGLKAAIIAMQMFVDNVVWKKVVYVDRLLQLLRYVPPMVPSLSINALTTSSCGGCSASNDHWHRNFGVARNTNIILGTGRSCVCLYGGRTTSFTRLISRPLQDSSVDLKVLGLELDGYLKEVIRDLNWMLVVSIVKVPTRIS